MSKQKTESDHYDETLIFLKGALAQAGKPVSDGHAHQSAQLTKHAWEALFPRSGWTRDVITLRGARPALMEAIRLDYTNTFAMILLAGTFWSEARAFADLAEAIAKRAKGLLPEALRTPHKLWSVGDSHERTYLTTIVHCVNLLDSAERYESANRLRLEAMKRDKRDGFGFRYFVVAHALMVGDVTTVRKWLKWASKERQRLEFWCWVEVLLARLSGDADADATARAMTLEPLVPFYIVLGPQPIFEIEGGGVRVGSDQEQHYHAAILERAWLSHPDDFDLLFKMTESVRKAARNAPSTH